MFLLFYNKSLTSTQTNDPNSFLCYYQYNKRWKNNAPSPQEVMIMGAAILDLSRDRLDHVTHFWNFSKRQFTAHSFQLCHILFTHKIDHQKKTTFVSFNIGCQLQKLTLLQVLIICQNRSEPADCKLTSCWSPPLSRTIKNLYSRLPVDCRPFLHPSWVDNSLNSRYLTVTKNNCHTRPFTRFAVVTRGRCTVGMRAGPYNGAYV